MIADVRVPNEKNMISEWRPDNDELFLKRWAVCIQCKCIAISGKK